MGQGLLDLELVSFQQTPEERSGPSIPIQSRIYVPEYALLCYFLLRHLLLRCFLLCRWPPFVQDPFRTSGNRRVCPVQFLGASGMCRSSLPPYLRASQWQVLTETFADSGHRIECSSVTFGTQRGRFIHRHFANGVFGHSNSLSFDEFRSAITASRCHPRRIHTTAPPIRATPWRRR